MTSFFAVFALLALVVMLLSIQTSAFVAFVAFTFFVVGLIAHAVMSRLDQIIKLLSAGRNDRAVSVNVAGDPGTVPRTTASAQVATPAHAPVPYTPEQTARSQRQSQKFLIGLVVATLLLVVGAWLFMEFQQPSVQDAWRGLIEAIKRKFS